MGEAERQLRALFEEAARCAPSIIFFDEIDGLAPVSCMHACTVVYEPEVKGHASSNHSSCASQPHVVHRLHTHCCPM